MKAIQPLYFFISYLEQYMNFNETKTNISMCVEIHLKNVQLTSH